MGGRVKGLLIMRSKIDNTRIYWDYETKEFQVWNNKGKKSLTRKMGYYILLVLTAQSVRSQCGPLR